MTDAALAATIDLAWEGREAVTPVRSKAECGRFAKQTSC
jgi:hypothetical protein